MSDFDPTSLLTMPVDDIKEPTPLPTGSYIAVSPDYSFDKTKPADTSKQPTNLVKVAVKLVEAFPDVDQAELAQALNGKQLLEIDQRPLEFFLTEAAAFRLKDFLTADCKIEEGANLSEKLEVLKSEGKQFGVEIGLVPNKKNPDRPYRQIVRTFALLE